jgi:short-subunit dehydrogenase involved in D-alanine esterification of teichoic acids
VALVTGASSGIGAAICEHLAAAGAKVALAARREDRLKRLETQIARQGGTAVAVTMDVCNEHQVYQHFRLCDYVLEYYLTLSHRIVKLTKHKNKISAGIVQSVQFE